MASFPFKIVTPDGLIYDGEAEKVIVRTKEGDMAVLARHINCVCPLGMGEAVVVIDGKRRTAACIGGLLSVINGSVSLIPNTFEWAEDINLDRAEKAKARAEAALKKTDISDREIKIAQARLNRALVRSSVANNIK